MNRTERILDSLDSVPYIETGPVRSLDDLWCYNLLDEWVQWTVIDDCEGWGPNSECRIAVFIKVVEGLKEHVIFYAQRYIGDYDVWEVSWQDNYGYDIDNDDERELLYFIKYGYNKWWVANTSSMFLPFDKFYLEER